MNTRKWHKGPPPHVGWWNASLFRDHRSWRWWNGKNWSIEVSVKNKTLYSKAAMVAKLKSPYQTEIEWTNYYPKNARVPRVAP